MDKRLQTVDQEVNRSNPSARSIQITHLTIRLYVTTR